MHALVVLRDRPNCGCMLSVLLENTLSSPPVLININSRSVNGKGWLASLSFNPAPTSAISQPERYNHADESRISYTMEAL